MFDVFEQAVGFLFGTAFGGIATGFCSIIYVLFLNKPKRC